MPQLMPRCCLILSFFAALFSCPTFAADNHMVTRYIRKPPVFDHLDATGMVKVVLIQDSTLRPHIALSGPRSALNKVSIDITAKTLHINLPNFDIPEMTGNQYPVSVHVYVPKITSIATAGSTHVNAYFEYQNAPLALFMRNDSMVRINGLVNINYLIQANTSKSHIVFSNSKDLNMVMHHYSRAYIAGRADHVFARTDGYAVLNAKHLRAKYAWLQNTDHSVSMLSPLTQLDAFSTGHANVIAMTKRGLQTSHYSRDHANVITVRMH